MVNKLQVNERKNAWNQEIDDWLKDLEQRDKEAAKKDGCEYKDYPEALRDIYTFVVVIPEEVYDLLAPDEQAKFDGCDLSDWTDFVESEYGVEADELNDLWERKFFDLNYGDNNDEGIWYGLGKNIKNKPVDEVLVFNM